jgi:hypothetical protein
MAPSAELIAIEHDGKVLLSSNVTPGFFVSGRDRNEAAARFVQFLRRTGAMPMADTRAGTAANADVDPSRPRAMYIGFPFDANWGDRWMYQVLARRLPVQFVHPRTLEQHWQRAAPRGHYDLALLGGGTLINQKPQFYQEVAAALGAGLPVAAFGTGVGEPERWGDHRAQWAPLLAQFRFLGVRGPLSGRLLAEAGVTNHVVTGDSCLLEDRPPLGAVTSGAGPLSLWLDLSFGAQETRDSLLFRHDLLALLARLERERRIAITLFTTWPVYLPWIEEQIAVSFGERRPVLTVDEKTRGRLAEADLGLVWRLHAAAGLLHFAVPTLVVSYESKCRDHLAHLGLDDLVVGADADGLGRVRQVLEGDLEAWRRPARDRIAAAVDQGHAQAEQHLQRFVAAVAARP